MNMHAWAFITLGLLGLCLMVVGIYQIVTGLTNFIALGFLNAGFGLIAVAVGIAFLMVAVNGGAAGRR